MKKLILLRHGKAEEFAATDFERGLKERGSAQSKQRGAWLKQKQFIPDLILSSDAQRTRETTQQVIDGLELPDAPVQWQHALYNATSSTILSHILTTDDAIQTLLVIGHNNGISELASFFHSDYVGLKTSGFAVFDFATKHWSELLNVSIKHKYVQQESE